MQLFYGFKRNIKETQTDNKTIYFLERTKNTFHSISVYLKGRDHYQYKHGRREEKGEKADIICWRSPNSSVTRTTDPPTPKATLSPHFGTDVKHLAAQRNCSLSLSVLMKLLTDDKTKFQKVALETPTPLLNNSLKTLTNTAGVKKKKSFSKKLPIQLKQKEVTALLTLGSIQ